MVITQRGVGLWLGRKEGGGGGGGGGRETSLFAIVGLLSYS
jgi:hypothetical protein